MGGFLSTLSLDKSDVKSVIGLKNDKPEYNLPAVKALIIDGPAKADTKVFVICISGDYRSGKSFLMNLLVTYMAFYCENGTDDEWTTKEDMPIKGGKWAAGEDAVTKGIGMLMFPKLIDGKAIILMDCQGSKDTIHSSPTMDNLILFLGLELSDVHMLNITTTIKATDYERLDLCVYHADDDKTDDESSGSLFERHIFLVRDWGNANKPKSIDQVIQQTQTESMKKAAMGIKQAFRVVENEALPFPGERVIGASSEAGDLTIGDVSPRFLNEARLLFHKLTIELPKAAKRSCGEFLTQFEFVSKRSVGKISTPQEAHEESLIKSVFKKSSTYFYEEMAKLKNLKLELTEEQMDEKLKAAHDEAVRRFTSNKRVQKCENQHLATDYLRYLETIYKENKALMEKACLVEKLAKEVEERKKHEDDIANRLKQVEDEFRQAKADVQRLEFETKKSNNLDIAELLKEAINNAFEKESLKAELARRDEQARAEAQNAARQQQQEIDELKRMLLNSQSGDASMATGKDDDTYDDSSCSIS